MVKRRPRQPSPDPSPLSEAEGRALQFCRILGCHIGREVAVGKSWPDPRFLKSAQVKSVERRNERLPRARELYVEGRVAEAGKRRAEAGYAIIAINAINAIIDCMASITIRKLPETTKRRLRIRAARNGRSMEQEARELLETGLAQPDFETVNIGEAIRRRFAPLGGVDLKIPLRRISNRENPFK